LSSETSAPRLWYALSFAAVGRDGNTIATLRSDHAQLGALSRAEEKAFTAVAFESPTRVARKLCTGW